MRFVLASLLTASLLGFSLAASAQSSTDHVVISIGLDAVLKLRQEFREDFVLLKRTGDVALVRLPAKDLLRLSDLMHKTFDRCGGFVVEKNYEEAVERLNEFVPVRFETPRIQHQDVVQKAISMVEESKIRSSIETLSAFQNRLYTSDTGVRSQEWVGSKWRELLASVPNTELQYFEHSNYPQRFHFCL